MGGPTVYLNIGCTSVRHYLGQRCWGGQAARARWTSPLVTPSSWVNMRGAEFRCPAAALGGTEQTHEPPRQPRGPRDHQSTNSYHPPDTPNCRWDKTQRPTSYQLLWTLNLADWFLLVSLLLLNVLWLHSLAPILTTIPNTLMLTMS